MSDRQKLIEEEAKRRCLLGGYTLDTPAKALTSFAHREGPLWQAYVPRVEAEIERIEEAGFAVFPEMFRDPFAWVDVEAAEPRSSVRLWALYLVGVVVMVGLFWARRN